MQSRPSAACAGRLAVVALFSTLAPAGASRGASHVRRSPAPALQAEVAGPLPGLGAQAEELQAALQDSLAVGLWRVLPAASSDSAALANGQAPQAQGAKAQGSKAGHGPVKMQLPQQDIDRLSANLSEGCKVRVSAILAGNGPQLHTFGNPGSGNTSAASCQQLKGSICSTWANVMQSKVSNGRKMRSTTEVEGDGCLPSECVAEKDLHILASFMHLKAKELVPGMGVSVALRVNCTQSNGSFAEVSSGPVFEEAEAAKHSGAHSPAAGGSLALLLAAAAAALRGACL